MSCPAGRFSSSILAVKSLSGSAAIGGNARALAKDSVVATSTIICEGRSARAQTTPPSAPMSPDCTPWVMTGRSAARLRYGIATIPAPSAAGEERNFRREIPMVMQASWVGRGLAQTDLESFYDDQITATMGLCLEHDLFGRPATTFRDHLGGAGSPELRARSMQVLRHAHQQRLAVG